MPVASYDCGPSSSQRKPFNLFDGHDDDPNDDPDDDPDDDATLEPARRAATASACTSCHERFGSRNELFRHLRASPTCVGPDGTGRIGRAAPRRRVC